MQNLNDALPDVQDEIRPMDPDEWAAGAARKREAREIAALEEQQREAQRLAWQNRMDQAGIPPRYRPAHLLTNCTAYADVPDKDGAYRMAMEMSKRRKVVQRDRDRFCLVFAGEYGTGKTWLATALFKHLIYGQVKGKARSGMWRKFYDFVREVQASYSPAAISSADQIIRGFQRVGVLLLDDVGELEKGSETEDRRRLLYEVIDYRNDYLLPTLITTNLNGRELRDQFGERTWERIEEMAALVSMRGANLRREPLPETTTEEDE